MTLLSVVIPTIEGREESLERTLKAYEETLRGQRSEIILVRDYPNWPAACNYGYRIATGDVIHFGADDLVPLPGWHEPALTHLAEHDELPAARVMNYRADGVMDNAEDGKDGEIVWFTRVPILTRSQYERIGAWPEIPYMADVWVSEKGRSIGIETRILYDYAFVHHWHQHGRLDDEHNLKISREAMDRWRRTLR